MPKCCWTSVGAWSYRWTYSILTSARKGFPLSSSRSPASSAAPVRFPRFRRRGGDRERARIGHDRTAMKAKKRENVDKMILRLPRWRDPGPRRVHGRHHPLHHPQRQGPRYEISDTPILAQRLEGTPGSMRTRRLTQGQQFARTTFCACSSLSVRPGV